MKWLLSTLIFVVSMPFIIKVLGWVITSIFNPSPASIERGGELIGEAAIPWWLPIVQALASIEGLVGGLLVLAFLYWIVKENAV